MPLILTDDAWGHGSPTVGLGRATPGQTLTTSDPGPATMRLRRVSTHRLLALGEQRLIRQ